MITLRLDQDLLIEVGVEGENEPNLVALIGLHARERKHHVCLSIKRQGLGRRMTTGPWSLAGFASSPPPRNMGDQQPG